MAPTVLVAGLDVRGLLLEAPFLQRTGHVVDECSSARVLLAALPGTSARLVVLGTALGDLDPVEVVRRIRAERATRGISVLVIVPATDPPEIDGRAVEAGANAVLRRPLEPALLESWLAKLLEVPRRVEARAPVQAVVLGSLRQPTSHHFYGQARNLSVHGMLLASPVRLEPEPELELQFELPEKGYRLRALGRVVRESEEVAWPFLGYGVEFLFVPPEGVDAILDLVQSPPPADDRPPPLHSTLRRDSWVYEIHEPVRRPEGFYVEIRRALREAWRPGSGGPFYVVEGATAESALEGAREFIQKYG